jgi:transaldolase
MDTQYFQRVTKLSPTRFWINNPTREQADLAIAAGAVGCTNNPSYSQKIIDHPREGLYASQLLDDAIQETNSTSEAVVLFQRKLVIPIAEKFLPLYRQSDGEQGYVSIQGDPINEEDPDVILLEARNNLQIGKNICCKVPTTEAGLRAMEVLIGEGVAVNATEIFGVSQMISVCELYKRVTWRTGLKPMLYMSHIAGIYDDYLKNYVDEKKVKIEPDILWQAGLAIARKTYNVMKERDYSAVFVAGGARGLQHFTEMVGGEVCVTINWEGMADKLLEANYPVVYRIFNPVPQKVIDELMEKLPDFKRGYLDDGLSEEEYEGFGPVQLFRSSFIKSWKQVLNLAEERRKALEEGAIHLDAGKNRMSQ